MISHNPKAGAFNLLKNCLNIKAKDSVLVVQEPDDTFYDKDVFSIIRECLNEINAQITVVKPPLISDPVDFPNNVADVMQRRS